MSANREMQLLTFSLNHTSCSLKSLGKISSISHAIEDLAPSLIQEESIAEIVPIATCNRVEFVMACRDTEQARHAVLKHLSNYWERPYSEIESQSQFFTNDAAVHHLFYLVSGLESLVKGDAQILGQVKKSYQASAEKNRVGKTLHTVFQKSFAAAKKVRTQTGLGKGRVSISALAVDYIRRHTARFSGSSVVVIGAGKMGALCIKYLQDQDWKTITLVNRTPEKCQPFADEFGVDIAALSELPAVLAEADVVISATAACEFVITPELAGQAERRVSKPRMYIDIAMPSDIDPDVADVPHVTLIGLEDLRSIADENQSQRAAAMQQAERILNEELAGLGSWPMPLQIDVITAGMGEYACNVLQEETAGLYERLSSLTPEEEELIRAKITRIAERLVLAPRRMLREAAAGKLTPEAVAVLDQLFSPDQLFNPNLHSTHPIESKPKS